MPTAKVTPKDFFLWAGAMVSLYVVAYSLGSLLFSYIDYAYPDQLDYYVDPYSGAMRFAMASLIVLFPALLFLMRAIRSDAARDPSRRDVWVRRWALYLTIFIAGAAVIADLITLINYFLGGDLTTRFVLKVAVVAVIAGGGFGYVLGELRGFWNASSARVRALRGALALVVAGTILGGFFIIGSPSEVRLYRIDDQRVSDLQSIQSQIIYFWQQKDALPASLAALEDPISGFIAPVDPETGEAYRYRIAGPLSFELCASFNKETRAVPEVKPVRPSANDTWDHEAGDVCFARSIDPELYTPRVKTID